MKKKYMYITLVLLMVGAIISGCDSARSDMKDTTEITSEITDTVDKAVSKDKLNQRVEIMGKKVTDLQSVAATLNTNGNLEDEEYEKLIMYSQRFEDIRVKINTKMDDSQIQAIDKELNELDKELDAFNENVKLKKVDNSAMKKSLESLILSAKEVKSVVDKKIAEGKISEEKSKEIAGYISTMDGYIKVLDKGASDAVRDEMTNDVGAIKGSLVAIAGEVSTDNKLIDKIMGIE